MTGAMYAAIGGLKSHMSKLNVIGNNVANVNTYGYKAQRMTFKESMYTTSRSGSNGGPTAGGNNPSQVGYGCSVGSIDLNMSPSTYAPTGYGLDAYIDGEGFYMFGDKPGAGEVGILGATDMSRLELSRVGDLWIDPDGYVCNRDGKVLYGFSRVQNPNYKANPTDAELEAAKKDGIDITSKTIVSTQLAPIRVPLSAAAPTTENGGIDANGSKQWEEGEPVYPYLSKVEQGAGDNKKTYYINQYAKPGDKTDLTPGYEHSTVPVAENTDENNPTIDVLHIQLKSMGVEKNGAITGIAANGETVILGYIAIANVDSPDGVTHIDGPYYKAMGGAGSLRVSALGGVLQGKYLGNQVAEDDKAPDANDAIMNDKSIEIRKGGLEASSTDVATEFSEMITTQRGYQANTRIITVTDSMLEELVNMKR
ncbi:MAG: flagellar hook-basal body complex protein [Lawsonibacter sp.]|nr:flagellar hook-basal body complex protein [Lawsonibacter sp.]MCI9026951.1 flagellar hook-basal body complex protein [Lawsonibacter sp.]